MFHILYNYIQSAFRNIFKNKIFSILNLISLSVGIAACLLLFQYVFYENSFDKFHENSENIYRIRYDGYRNGNLMFACAAAVPAVGPAMKENFPEVLEFSWAFPQDGILSTGDNISFRERKIQIATPSFLRMFDWEIIRGDTSALTLPYSAVITESTAKKYFGNEDPIGKELILWGEHSCEVRGVMKDIPENSHIKFTVLISAETLHQQTDNQSRTAWGWYDFNTYILLEEGADPMEFQQKFADWLAEEKKEEWEEYNGHQEFILQPLEDIHLHSELLQESEPEENGDANTVSILSLIALSVLIIAWVNYINMSSSRALERAREVGIRKVVGAHRRQLIRQFLFEAFLMNILAAGISILIVALVLPSFNQLTGRNLTMSLFGEPTFWAGLSALFLAGALLSGLYPAFVLSSFKPIEVLKGKFSNSGKGYLFRKILVVFQFSASVSFIAGTVLIYSQLKYMRDQDLGVNIDQTLVLKGPGVGIDTTFNEKFKTFKNEIKSIPGIEHLSASTNIPGDEIFWASGIRRTDEEQSRGVMYKIGLDEDYIPAFDIEILAGRNFSPEYGTEDLAVIINKKCVEFIEYESPEEAIGQKVHIDGEDRHIIGVIADYHQMSLKQEPIPLIYFYIPANRSFFAMKISPDRVDQAIDELKVVYDDFFPGNPFNYFFLDVFYDRQYRIEKQIFVAIGVFSLVAIIIAALGLFGLSSYTILQRTREIGIRKVHGASVTRILFLLSREFLELIILSIVISTPITWWGISKWMENYPYQVGINWGVFLVTGLLVILFALFAVAIQTIRAANTNPAQSLKYE
ncbi:MAG: ABC transporter permease [Bacteroidales bacterium]|nr:ABC transporter permease [Bacteroidales bacterium]